MELIVLQILSALGIFLTLVLLGLFPYICLSDTGKDKDGRSKGGSLLLSFCNCFACGVFLGTCFLGLIPHIRHHEEVIEGFINHEPTPSLLGVSGVPNQTTASSPSPQHHQFWHRVFSSPITELLVLIGFLMTLMIEQIVPLCGNGHGHGHSHTPLLNGHHNHHQEQRRRRKKFDRKSDLFGVDSTDDEEEHELLMLDALNPFAVDIRNETQVKTEGKDRSKKDTSISLRSLVLLFALSVHSVFEGLALGLQETQARFYQLLIAIMIHEVLCAFAYGLSLAREGTRSKTALASIIVLSCCIPVGQLAAVIAIPNDQSMTTISFRFVMEGLAAGTFVHVACVEMVTAELGEHHHHAHSAATLPPASDSSESSGDEKTTDTTTHHHHHHKPSAWLGPFKVAMIGIGVATFAAFNAYGGEHHH